MWEFWDHCHWPQGNILVFLDFYERNNVKVCKAVHWLSTSKNWTHKITWFLQPQKVPNQPCDSAWVSSRACLNVDHMPLFRWWWTDSVNMLICFTQTFLHYSTSGTKVCGWSVRIAWHALAVSDRDPIFSQANLASHVHTKIGHAQF